MSSRLRLAGALGCYLSLFSAPLWAFGNARGIDGFRVVDPSRYQVFSERGIGAFNLIGQRQTVHSVCFFYGVEKPFQRLESITIAMATSDGDQKLVDFTVDQGCVEFTFNENENHPLQIEFVDVHR